MLKLRRSFHRTHQPSITPGLPLRRKKSRGQSLVEFAFVLPVLVLIFASAVDFGRALTAYIAISSAAREGAAFGMLNTANSNNSAGMAAAATGESGAIWGTMPTVSSAVGTDSTGNRYVQVTVSYVFDPLLSIPPIGNNRTLTHTVRMRVIN